MKISIITVAFNSAKTIRDTIESVLAQTYTQIEYIIVDGKSNDGTVEIIKEYEPKFNGRLSWVSEKDNGLYDAMNKGIQMATGEIVGIINSDDFYHRNDAIETIAKAFEDDELQATFADVRYVRPENLNKTIRYYSSKNFAPWRFRFGFMPAHPTFFTYKKYYDEFGYYRIDYKIAADYELLIRFLYTQKLNYKYLHIDMLKMRVGGISTVSLSSYLHNKENARACKENGIKTNLTLLSFRYILKLFEFFFTRK